jgi:hypothetical protein
MKFHFTTSGGFGGLRSELDGDSASLPQQYRQALESLASGTAKLTKRKSNPLARDVFKYDLSVQDTSKPFSVHFDDTNLPPEMESLFDYLRQAASSVNKKR